MITGFSSSHDLMCLIFEYNTEHESAWSAPLVCLTTRKLPGAPRALFNQTQDNTSSTSLYSHWIGKERTSIALTFRIKRSKQSILILNTDKLIPNTVFGTGSLSLSSGIYEIRIKGKLYTKFSFYYTKVFTFIQRFIVYIRGTDLQSICIIRRVTFLGENFTSYRKFQETISISQNRK